MEKYITAKSLTGAQIKLQLKPEKTMREWMLDFLPYFTEKFGNSVDGNTFKYFMINDNKKINTNKQRHIKSKDLINDQTDIYLVYTFGRNAELVGNLDPSGFILDLDTCAICSDTMPPHSKHYDVTLILKCKHAFHYKCIIEDMQNGRNICPICRQPHNTYIPQNQC